MKIFYLVLVALLLQQPFFAQQGLTGEFKYKAIYQLTYQPDSTNTESSLNEPMVLYIGDEVSRFSSLGKAVGDSIRANANLGNRDMAAFQRLQGQLPKTEFAYDIYKQKPEGKLYFAERIARDNLIYEENIPLMEWEMATETKELEGYRVQKATTSFAGRNYIGWFTTEIPVTDGPYKFSGLPGLILELRDEQNDYVFTLTDFQKLESPVPLNFKGTNLMHVEKKEFIAIKREYDLNPLAAMERSGIKIQFTPAQEAKAKREITESF